MSVCPLTVITTNYVALRARCQPKNAPSARFFTIGAKLCHDKLLDLFAVGKLLEQINRKPHILR